LFYLRARGIDARAAVGLLTRGFAADVTGRIAIEALTRRLERLLETRLESVTADEDKR